MGSDTVDPTGLLDESTAPFTFRELVAADLILGLTREEASGSWRLAFGVMRRLRQQQAMNPADPDLAYEITLRDANLAALSLLSPEVASRVDQLRRGRRPSIIEEWRQNRSEGEFAEKMRGLEEEDMAWDALMAEVSRMAGQRTDDS